jgi:hypothetical protein
MALFAVSWQPDPLANRLQHEHSGLAAELSHCLSNADQAAYRAKRKVGKLHTQYKHRKHRAKINIYDWARRLRQQIENRLAVTQPANPSRSRICIISLHAELSASTTLLGLTGQLVNHALAGPIAVHGGRRTH